MKIVSMVLWKLLNFLSYHLKKKIYKCISHRDRPNHILLISNHSHLTDHYNCTYESTRLILVIKKASSKKNISFAVRKSQRKRHNRPKSYKNNL
jgi:hypothetical protein